MKLYEFHYITKEHTNVRKSSLSQQKRKDKKFLHRTARRQSRGNLKTYCTQTLTLYKPAKIMES